MRHVAFSMEFRGHSIRLGAGVVTARATAPSSAFVTRIDHDGIHGGFERADGDEAHLECRLTFLDESSFDQVGTISFGNGNALRFRSSEPGRLIAAAVPELLHGTASWEVDGGAGAFEGVTGRIVSNFLVSDTGDLTDRQLGVLFFQEVSRCAA